MRTRFDKELDDLNLELIHMGSLVEQSIQMAVKALTVRDKVLARNTVEFDAQINEMDNRIEQHCLKLLLHQQPVADDLILISTALKMITDLERIGDHASDISEIVLNMNIGEHPKKLDHISMMAKETTKMVNMSIDAYVKRDKSTAEEVIKRDDIVDNLFCLVRSEIIDLIHNDRNCGERAIDLIMIAKYFERIGDHAENVAEWAMRTQTGWKDDQFLFKAAAIGYIRLMEQVECSRSDRSMTEKWP